MAISARTRTLLTWLPATILAVVIGCVVIASLAIQESWWTQENPAASTDQKAVDGSTMLTDAGFDYVNVEGVVRVRIDESTLTATELGLPADGAKSADFRRPVRALIAAGDEVHVLDDIASLTATAEQDRLVTLTLTPDVVRGWTGALDYLRALAPEFGWDVTEIDSLDEEIGEFNRSGEGETFTASIGPSAEGTVSVTAELTFDRSSGATPVTITFAPVG